MPIDIKQFGKGAKRTPKEVRDRQYRLAATPALIDWSTPYTVEGGFILDQRDQKSSSSCTAQATMYYCESLDSKHRKGSARYNYSQTFIPGGGAYIWKAMSIPQKPGVASQISVPDGDSSEATMTNSSLNGQAVLMELADKYAVIPRSSIDQMAQVVKDYQGFITGFNGWDGMFGPDGTIVNWSNNNWGHAIYVCGYILRNGNKYLKFKNSWTAAWGDSGYGYIPEGFVNSGMLFDCYTYADVADLDPTSMGPSDSQLNTLYLAVFHRPIDPAGLAFHHGHTWDHVLVDIIGSKESQEYGKVYGAVKQVENDIRSGAF